MTTRIDRACLLFLLHDDRELYEHLCEAGFLPVDTDDFEQEHAETARVVGTLVHELEVNWSGVEIVLRMRSELVATQRQVAGLLAFLRERRDSSRDGL